MEYAVSSAFSRQFRGFLSRFYVVASSPGFCGVTSDHCGAGCQSPFGRCNGGSSSSQPRPQPRQPATSRPNPQPERTSSSNGGGDDICGAMLGMVNAARGRVGARPLRCASELYPAAKNHSDDMARNRFLSHDGEAASPDIRPLAVIQKGFAGLLVVLFPISSMECQHCLTLPATLPSESQRFVGWTQGWSHSGVYDSQ